MENKIMKQLKQKENRRAFLKEFLVFALSEQNKYLKINDAKEIENLNIVIQYTLKQIDELGLAIHELKRDARLVR